MLDRSYLCSSAAADCLLPALHFGESLSQASFSSRIKMGIPPTAFSPEAPPIPFLGCARPMFSSRALCMPRCRDPDTAAPHSSRGSPAISLQGRRGRILVHIRRPCRATSYESAPQDSAAAAQLAWPPSTVLVAAAAALALDESGGLESAAERESGGAGAGARPKCPASRRPTAAAGSPPLIFRACTT